MTNLLSAASKRLIGARLPDLNEGDVDNLSAKVAQSGRKSAGLMLRAADQNAKAGKGLVWNGCVF
jgi:hypothetical protein